MKHSKGFTLLEMLLALLLGALLMTIISSLVSPLLRTQSGDASASAFNTREQAQDFFDNIELIAQQSRLVFPNALHQDTALSSVALQFLGSGGDTSADANGDGEPGIAGMDSTADRATGTLRVNDDDKDGKVDEDPINGLDDDNDGLTDEDPGANSDDQDRPGVAHLDDNQDGIYDQAKAKPQLLERKGPWYPYLPKSLYSTHQPTTEVGYVSLFSSAYKVAFDDNEDGISNNNPMVTWSARLEGDELLCNTPIVSYRTDSKADKLAKFTYREYTCLENVTDFRVTRSVTATGSLKLALVLELSEDGGTYNYTHSLYLQ